MVISFYPHLLGIFCFTKIDFQILLKQIYLQSSTLARHQFNPTILESFFKVYFLQSSEKSKCLKLI